MADFCDDSQVAEAAFREAALARVPRYAGPAPVKVNGRTCCAECGEPIAFARLAALPGVGLCVECAEELVQITRGW